MLSFVGIDLHALFENRFFQAAVFAVGGLFATALLGLWAYRRLRATGQPHRALVISKVIGYAGTFLVLIAVFDALGWELTHLLATAGILTVAVGFAAQTSLGNMIAGLFLLIDKPFEVGNTVEMETKVGVVEKITLLSTYVRTFDNLLVRWPNEVVLKATIVNYASHPVRRLETRVGVAYGSDLARVRELLLETARDLPMGLIEPPPEVWFDRLGNDSVEVLVRVWTPTPDVLHVRSSLVMAVHEAMRREGFEIPFPQRTVWLRREKDEPPGDDLL